ncbi:unnamed protein product [Porites lobata]|uniref:Uncharacterized protein n=1 Tax=Porites lobata TaxID=104759 RepID=A0ABN8MS52_9CNID|nr:unnamed protein product [Porites lobata]
MENVTFVYALATEQERQTEALKNQQQNQLEKYRHVIQRQKEKERAFLSFKKVEFLSRQETKLNVLRPSSARTRMDDKLPEVTRKGREIALKRGLLATGNEFMNVLPFYRQKTHIGTGFVSSWRSGISSNPSVMQRKPLTLQGHQPRMIVNQKRRNGNYHHGEKTAISSSVTKKIPGVGVDHGSLGKFKINSPSKHDGVRHVATGLQFSDDCSNQEKDESNTQRSNKGQKLQSVDTTVKMATEGTERGCQVSWAVVARLIGLKMKFKRRQFHGTFQAPELEVLDPSLKTERKVDQGLSSDPLKVVRGCRYLRIPDMT